MFLFGWLTGRGTDAPTAPRAGTTASATHREPATIDPRTLAATLAAPEAPLVIDVREPQEYAQGHIQHARLMPLSQLRSRVGELPKDRPIVCVCLSGSRSAAATRQLRALGYSARNLTGGMLGWRGPVVTGGAR